MKKFKNMSHDKKVLAIVSRLIIPITLAEIDIDNYKAYSNGEFDTLTEKDIKSMEILDSLARLGYNLDNLGTFIYKELIYDILTQIEYGIDKESINIMNTILCDLKDDNSKFINDFCDDYLEIGKSKVNELILSSYNDIDTKNFDEDFANSLFGNVNLPLSVREEAFIIASCVAKRHSVVKTLK